MVRAKHPSGVLPSALVLIPVFIAVPLLSMWKHYALPAPLTDLYDPATQRPQLSESAILAHARHLSETIGFRTVGTREHALGDAWMLDAAREVRSACEAAVTREPGRRLECEVWRQEGNGSHRFDIMGKRVYKTYVNLSNIVLRVSDGTPASKAHAVLVNAHLDSTLPSPGAADDAMSVGVMLEVARNLIETRGWEPTWSIIFLFNNAEESLQDGSHLFSTQHPIASTVRAIINLEAAGTTGPELLFQATSQQMIEAYSHVPRPYGTILANDVFSSGIIMSDTDFRQFELYLNVTGLDMAIVGNSYFYHTRKDLVEYIEPGAAQHMAENALALILHLSSAASPLPTLTTGYSRPTMVFFSLFNSIFIQYSFRTANTLHVLIAISATFFLVLTSRTPVDRKGKGKARDVVDGAESMFKEQMKGVGLISAALLGAIVAANGVAFAMSTLLDKRLSWFKVEYSCFLLYSPAALTGALASQLLSRTTRERTMLSSVLIAHSFLALTVQLAGIGSAVMFFLSSSALLLALMLDRAVMGAGRAVWLGTYVLGQCSPLLFGTEIFVAIADIFVPLTGRMGAEAPAEHIIASMVALIASYTFALLVPFFHRFGQRFLQRSLVFSAVLTGVMMAVFALRSPFDAMHPKRLYILHSENITTNEVHLHMAAADGAPGFGDLVQDIAIFVAGDNAQAHTVDMSPYNNNWDSVYPFSAFLAPYTVQLDSYVSQWAVDKSFGVTAVNDVVDEAAGTRSLTMVIRHPGLIWTVVAFDAYVLKWSLDDYPPQEHARHHIKEGSFYGVDAWSIDLVIKLPPAGEGLQVNFVGVQEKAMWPGKKSEMKEGGGTMRLFEALDGWLEEHTGGMVDATLLGCVGGVNII